MQLDVGAGLVGLMPADKPVIALSDAGREVVWKAP